MQQICVSLSARITVSNVNVSKFSTLFRTGLFRVAGGWGGEGGKKAPLPKICHRYPTMMKLSTGIPYPKKIQKIYESQDIPLEFS